MYLQRVNTALYALLNQPLALIVSICCSACCGISELLLSCSNSVDSWQAIGWARIQDGSENDNSGSAEEIYT